MKKILLLLIILGLAFSSYGAYVRSKMSDLAFSIQNRTKKIALYVEGLSRDKSFFKENLTKISDYYDKARATSENFFCKIFCTDETKETIEESYARMETLLD